MSRRSTGRNCLHDRCFRLNRASHPGRERDCDLLHCGLATRTHRQKPRTPLGASVLEATSAGQVLATGTAVTPKQVTAAPFVICVKLDDDKLAASLPAGTVGNAAIYTPHIKPSHIIRKVILRQIAIV